MSSARNRHEVCRQSRRFQAQAVHMNGTFLRYSNWKQAGDRQRVSWWAVMLCACVWRYVVRISAAVLIRYFCVSVATFSRVTLFILHRCFHVYVSIMFGLIQPALCSNVRISQPRHSGDVLDFLVPSRTHVLSTCASGRAVGSCRPTVHPQTTDTAAEGLEAQTVTHSSTSTRVLKR